MKKQPTVAIDFLMGMHVAYVSTSGRKYFANYAHEITAEEVLEDFNTPKSRKYFKLIK